jgi:hypothetical protein
MIKYTFCSWKGNSSDRFSKGPNVWTWNSLGHWLARFVFVIQVKRLLKEGGSSSGGHQLAATYLIVALIFLTGSRAAGRERTSPIGHVRSHRVRLAGGGAPAPPHPPPLASFRRAPSLRRRLPPCLLRRLPLWRRVRLESERREMKRERGERGGNSVIGVWQVGPIFF